MHNHTGYWSNNLHDTVQAFMCNLNNLCYCDKKATVQFNFAVHSLDNHLIPLTIHIQLLHYNPPCSSVHHLKEGSKYALVEQNEVALALPGYLYPNHWSHPHEIVHSFKLKTITSL
jgi:hypothetical protein